jgi:lipopolysaccharide transport system ATP-binding protein
VDPPVIEATNLSKRYVLGSPALPYGRLTESLSAPFRRSRRSTEAAELWALKDLSFEVQAGSVLGIIGRNGAGKTTLLKLLSRITEPTKGEATLRGRVGSLLEVGTGFHPELTGLENIYLNGAILGMSRVETQRKFDEIVAFAEVERFLDTPVKRYSSGMYVRLAFAVAAHLEPDILIVDEVLAVGDLAFQRKCIEKMGAVSEGGHTVLIVSHNMGTILRLCDQAMLLETGGLVDYGPAAGVIDRYVSTTAESGGEYVWEAPNPSSRLWPIALRLRNANGNVSDHILANESCAIEFEYELPETLHDFRVGLLLATLQGETLFQSMDTDAPDLFESFRTRGPGTYKSVCYLPADLLNEGRFTISVEAASFGIRKHFHAEHRLSFTVDASAAVGNRWPETRAGALRPSLEWRIEGS